MSDSGNLHRDLPDAGGGEVVERLLAVGGVEIERIVSLGQASPEGFWYEQARGEWVLLVAGEAGLRFEDEDRERVLGAGDWVWIEAGRRHRVEWTAADVETVWLAVFVKAPDGSA